VKALAEIRDAGPADEAREGGGSRKRLSGVSPFGGNATYAGGFNYTQPANDYDENLFVLGSVFPKVEKIAVNKGNCQALARHMKTEIERIIAASIAYSP
jgi:hypothetical protein